MMFTKFFTVAALATTLTTGAFAMEHEGELTEMDELSRAADAHEQLGGYFSKLACKTAISGLDALGLKGDDKCRSDCGQITKAATCMLPSVTTYVKEQANKKNICKAACNRYLCGALKAYQSVCVANCPKDTVTNCAKQKPSS